MRREGWEAYLARLVVEAEQWEFEWGVHDCVTFAGDVIEVLTGHDPIADLRGAWHDSKQARTKIDEMGGIEAGVSARLPRLAAPQMAGRGDLVLTDQDNLAVVVLNYAVALGRFGLVRYEPQRWVVGWRVA